MDFTDQQNLQLINSLFTTILSHCSASYIKIFYKTEIQTVILKCLTCLNLNWFKSFNTKRQIVQMFPHLEDKNDF